MKKILAITVCALPMAFAPAVYAQSTAADTGTGTGGATTPGSTAPAAPAPPATTAPAAPPAGGAPAAPAEQTEAISGWSVKDKIMGNSVHNENDEKIGEITDVVLASDGKAAYFIVGAGGFLGMGARDVAIPFDEITQTGDKLILQGYTKDQLKALPKVEVAQ